MSVEARIVRRGLKRLPKPSEENTEDTIAQLLSQGEKPTPAPRTVKTRHEDLANGRVFYANETSETGCTIFYIHGGAYMHDFSLLQWRFIRRMIEKTGARIIAPAYRLVPFATWKEAFDFIVPLYSEYVGNHPEEKIILMGDSAGGGLAAALAEEFKIQGIRMPDELILLSPWVDISMENPELAEAGKREPWLSLPWLKVCARYWVGDLDMHDYHVSPLFGDLTGLRNVTVYVGTDEIIYPDVKEYFYRLDEHESNELVVGKGMNHEYPLLPIREGKSADEHIFEIILR